MKPEEFPKETKQTKLTNPALFGIKQETADKIRTDILPAVPLSKLAIGESIKIKILSDKPEIIKHKKLNAANTAEMVETPILKVFDFKTQMMETLWLSSISLKLEIYKIARSVDSIKDKIVIIRVESYKSVKYGICRGYRAQLINE